MQAIQARGVLVIGSAVHTAHAQAARFSWPTPWREHGRLVPLRLKKNTSDRIMATACYSRMNP